MVFEKKTGFEHVKSNVPAYLIGRSQEDHFIIHNNLSTSTR